MIVGYVLWLMILFIIAMSSLSLTIELIKERRESTLTILTSAGALIFSAVSLAFSIKDFINLLKRSV